MHGFAFRALETYKTEITINERKCKNVRKLLLEEFCFENQEIMK